MEKLESEFDNHNRSLCVPLCRPGNALSLFIPAKITFKDTKLNHE